MAKKAQTDGTLKNTPSHQKSKTTAKAKPSKESIKASVKTVKAVVPKSQKKLSAKVPKATNSKLAHKGTARPKAGPTKKGLRPRDGDPASPEITSPLTNASVTAGADLTVDCSTNRGDFGYIVDLLDVTPPGPPPTAVSFSIAAPAGTTFSTTIPATYIAAGKSYQLRLYVDPTSGTTPPNDDYTITVSTPSVRTATAVRADPPLVESADS